MDLEATRSIPNRRGSGSFCSPGNKITGLKAINEVKTQQIIGHEIYDSRDKTEYAVGVRPTKAKRHQRNGQIDRAE